MEETIDYSWIGKVPKEPMENLRFRRYLLTAAKRDVKKQAALRMACRKDILFYFNSFVFTYDPRLKNKAVPFITYPFQDEAIFEIQAAVRDQEQLLLQKSRDMGASWICTGTIDIIAQYEKGSKFLMMSRVGDLVDSPGEPDSLFWKIDFIHRHLPSWLRPLIHRRKMRIEYVASGANVTGCSTTGAAGVGGRATAVFIDEFSRFEPMDAKQVIAGIADVSPCRIWNFTPFGTAHPSYDLVTMAEKGKIRSKRMYWTAHPLKVKGHYTHDKRTNQIEVLDKTYDFPKGFEFQMDGRFFNHSVWFDKERAARGDDRYVAEMLEIDYQGSTALFFDAGTVHQLNLEFGRPPDVEGDLNYDLTTGMPREFIRVKGGGIKLWKELDNLGRLPPGLYVAGVDVSTGQGASNSCICVANVETGEKVLEYATPSVLPIEFAVKCVAICRWIDPRGNLKLAWELPGPGQAFGKQVMQLNYSPVFWRKNEMSISGRQTDTPGWYASVSNKRILLEQYREDLQTRAYINRSEPAFGELLDWEITPNGIRHMGEHRRRFDPTGASVNHGDRTIADGLCVKLIRETGITRTAAEQKVLPGSLAWHMQEEERSTGELYPNWRGRG